jgi:hypothetical protein
MGSPGLPKAIRCAEVTMDNTTSGQYACECDGELGHNEDKAEEHLTSS